MDYLYEAIKPTRLYIKQCPHCGLKYFGKHTGQDIEKYPGSGVYWNNHLNCHKVKPIHLWNSDWYYDTSIKRFALKFSYMNKIVESNIWANLKPEDGLDGGWDHVHNEETQRKARENAEKTMIEKYDVKHVSQLPQVKRSLFKNRKNRIGKTHTEESKVKMSVAASNRTHTDSTKDSIRNGVINHYQNKGVSFLFIDGERKEQIICLKLWCEENDLDYHKVFLYINKGPIKMIARYDTPTRRWFTGKEIRRI
jgi:hypothetical protein